jgi:CO/xanthine dehydrogenase Mo-binding subunit
MNAHVPALSRRALLQSLGAMIVAAPAASALAAAPSAPGRPALHPSELDSWIAISPDGRVTAFFGKPDVGQGVDLAIAQIVGEELDVDLDAVDLVVGDTALTCDQGGVSGSTGVQRGGIALRNAAAEARRLMLEQASVKLGAPVDQLKVAKGVVSVAGDPARRVTYGQLVGDGFFRSKLEWNGQYGNGLIATGKAKPKSPKDYSLVGTSPPRRDIPGKVFGDFEYVADMRLPNMMHGRVIRPPVAGATPVSVDEASLAAIRGAKVVRKADFIGVVAESEWDAIQAARALKVTWSAAPMPFVPHGDIYEHIRTTPAAKREVARSVGDVDKALAAGAKVVEAEYEWPFQSHSSLAPACAVADYRADGVTVWHPSQKPHATSAGIAAMLGLPVEKVRSISVAGPGSYGRNDAGDAAADAVVMSMLCGRPVRVQGTRADGHGWDPKGTASTHKVRAALDAAGKLVAYDYSSKGFSRMEVATAESEPSAMLAGQLLGFDNPAVHAFGTPEEAYEVPNRRMSWETVPTLLAKASPLRTSHLRDPLGPQLHFASECFMDECALAAGADPVAFRLAMLKNPRHRAVIEAARDKAGWKAGPPGARRGGGNVATGWGFAYSARGETVVAVAAEVEVDRSTGRIWPKRFVVAHDCGLIVNPQGLTQCIEGNVVHGSSRALFEEVKFDAKNVTSGDWMSYPILDIMDAPETVDVVLINRPELPASGAGEPSTRPIAAAIANAVYDATGVRLRTAPFTKERMKAALAKA